jgi:hypothetical protein
LVAFSLGLPVAVLETSATPARLALGLLFVNG